MKKPKTSLVPPSTPATTAAAQVDQDLVASAYRKVMNRQELTTPERTALKRHEKEKEERLRWQYYASIPKKHWNQMSGRQNQVLNDQAERYGLPFGGPVINLPVFVRALHNFLAENAVKLAREEDELMRGGPSPALERYREKRAALADLDLLERQNQLIPRDQNRQALGRIAAIIRGAGEALQRQFGPAALDILNEALDDAEAEIDRFFGELDKAAGAVPTEPRRSIEETADATGGAHADADGATPGPE